MSLEILQPIFIIGVGRSGTSLLQSMLNAHKNICFLPETQYLRKYAFNRSQRAKIENGTAASFIELLKKDSRFNRLEISPQEIVSSNEMVSVVRVYTNLISLYLDRKGKQLPGDKDPRNLDYIEKIKVLFPGARIIHIIRDPRDVVLSRTKAGWSKHWPFVFHSFIYNAQLVRGRKCSLRLFSKTYIEIFYEDLINDAGKELKEVCAFFGLDYDPSMLAYQQSARELVSESEMQWKKETLGPLLSNNKEKWKTAFSNYQITMIERICAPALKDLPYEPFGKWDALSLWEKVKIQFAILFSKMFALIYPLRVNWL